MQDQLSAKICVVSCRDMPVLGAEVAAEMMAQLHEDWQVIDAGRKLQRRIVVKGFNAAHHCANLAAFLGEQQGHHPDISFGWNYCDVIFTTHVVGRLTQSDFICAARFDRLVSKT